MIGLTEQQKKDWDRYILGVKQGTQAKIESEGRRLAILAAAELIEKFQRDSSLYFVNKTAPESVVMVGTAGAPDGYYATICALIQQANYENGIPHVFQDLHLTKKQFVSLLEMMQSHLKCEEKHEN